MTSKLYFAVTAEIGGGWLVWQTVRNKKPWYYILAGDCLEVVVFSTNCNVSSVLFLAGWHNSWSFVARTALVDQLKLTTQGIVTCHCAILSDNNPYHTVSSHWSARRK